MMKLILKYYDACMDAIKGGADVEALANLPVREEIGRFKYTENNSIDINYEKVLADINRQTEEQKAGRDD
jgi:V/A-type H+-transporting ATPase subunit A